MTIIQKLDGTIYDLNAIGIRTKDFIVSSPSPKHLTEEIEGRHGLVDMGTFFDARTIICPLKATATDLPDFVLLRDEIFRLLRGDEPFYLIDKRNPSKRWKVKTKNSFEITQQYVYGDFTVEFISFSPFCESVGTTLDPLTFEAEMWQIGQGLISEETKYIHSEATFSIFNAGDVDIDPRVFPLLIKFSGSSTNLKIENLSSDDEWQYSGTTTSSDVLEINNVRSLKNGTSVLGNTNKSLITIKKGWNDFKISGFNGDFEILFDFRFYYL